MITLNTAPLFNLGFSVVMLHTTRRRRDATSRLIKLDYISRKGTQSNWREKQARICVLCDAFVNTFRGRVRASIWDLRRRVARGLLLLHHGNPAQLEGSTLNPRRHSRMRHTRGGQLAPLAPSTLPHPLTAERELRRQSRPKHSHHMVAATPLPPRLVASNIPTPSALRTAPAHTCPPTLPASASPP